MIFMKFVPFKKKDPDIVWNLSFNVFLNTDIYLLCSFLNFSFGTHKILVLLLFAMYAVCPKKQNKKINTPIYSNTNHRKEMKLTLINMDCFLFQFDALKYFLGVRLHKWPPTNFNFFNVNHRIWQ